MKQILERIADTCSILMVKAQCFDLHDDKEKALKDMANKIDLLYEDFETLLKKYKEKTNEKHND